MIKHPENDYINTAQNYKPHLNMVDSETNIVWHADCFFNLAKRR